jgi:hypothetical protein
MLYTLRSHIAMVRDEVLKKAWSPTPPSPPQDEATVA